MSTLINIGVPVVLAAGNEATAGDNQVSQAPQIFANGNAFPIINVGSANADGVISDFSRRGDKVSIFADGEEVTCKGYYPDKESGTSFGNMHPS